VPTAKVRDIRSTVLDFLAAVTGDTTGHLGIEYELVHEDERREPPDRVEQEGATPPRR
jgi:hypothetical protein